MSWLARLRNAFRSDDVSDEIEREMAFHLAQRADELAAAGMRPDLARDEARRRFGNLGIQKEDTRGRDIFVWLETLIADLRYAFRGLRAAPGFTVVAIVSLALGIGANTAIFSLLNVAMFKSLPVSHPEELVEVTVAGGEASKGGYRFSQAMWEEFRRSQDVFAGALVYGSTGSGDLSTGGEMRPIAIGLVSGGFFSTLGLQPAAGRMLMDGDDRPGCAGVVVLTHAFWQSEFGGAKSAVGSSVRINGRPFEVVGVADEKFFGLGFGYYPPIWAPQCAGTIIRGPTFRGGGSVIARLKLGATIEESRARMAALAPAILEASLPADATAETAERHRRITFGVAPFSNGFPFLREQYGEALFVLMGLVAVVLLIACANTANLLLARATARQREIAVRLALGASRWRLIRQLVTESLLLSLLGAAFGMLFAAWGSGVLVALLSRRGRPVVTELSPDTTVLAFTIAVAVLAGVIFGLAPAWRAVRVDPQAAMKPGGRGVAEGYSHFGVGKALVVAQIALSLAMVAGAGLLVGSWRRLVAMDPGFHTDGVLLVSVNTRAAQIPDSQRAMAFRGIVERLRTLPGVSVASAAIRTPLGNTGWSAAIAVEGFGSGPRGNSVELNEVSDQYFATIGARIIGGRDFTSADVPSATRVAIVNEELARKYFHGPDAADRARAVGQRFRIDWGREGSTEYEIVGIVANTIDHSLQGDIQPLVYFALSQNPAPDAYINVAVRADQRNREASGLAASVNAAIMETHPRLSLGTRTLREQVDESVRLPHTLALLSGFFGALALLLASVGLYGIMSYNVARRRNEIGVRIALGAERARIVRMVLADVGRMLLAGVVIGVAFSLGALRLVSAFLYGVEPGDLATLALSAVTLAAVAVGAALLPAWRASRVDPVVALRVD